MDNLLSNSAPAELLPDAHDECAQQALGLQVRARARLGVALGAAAAVSACGGGGSGNGPTPSAGGGGSPAPTPTPSPSPSPSPTPTSSSAPSSPVWLEQAEAARFLLRAQFAATRGQIEAVRSEGRAAWLARHMQYDNDQTASQFLQQQGFNAVDAQKHFSSERPFHTAIWQQLFSGGNTTRKRIALALSEFFVVSVASLDTNWRSHAVAHYWDILNKHAFGNFRDLLEAVTLSPAMGAFLDIRGSKREDPATGRMPDENFAREVMQLFTIGLYELQIDGTLKTYAGQPVETYSNDDVVGLSRVFTGYNLDASGLARVPNPAIPGRTTFPAEIVQRSMTTDPSKWEFPSNISEHSTSAKSFLGTTIPPGTDAATSLRIALDRLFNHPNVGPFFGQQMIQRLVTSNPSPAYVARVARAFEDNGRGIRGDLKAVFQAILLDPEAYTSLGLNDMRFGKLREPALRFIQFARTFGMDKSDGLWISLDLSDPISRIGQVPLRPPSVFNFYRPRYVPPGSVTAANEMVAPELQITSETTVTAYINVVEDYVTGTASWLNDLRATFVAELEIAHDAGALLDHLDLVLTAGQLRKATRDTIFSALNAAPVSQGSPEDVKLKRIHTAVILIMCSHDYLVQK